jgi:hypothetical protein
METRSASANDWSAACIRPNQSSTTSVSAPGGTDATAIIASREVVTRRLLAEIQYQVTVLPTAGPACMSEHDRCPHPAEPGMYQTGRPTALLRGECTYCHY